MNRIPRDNGDRRTWFSVLITMVCLALFLSGVGTGMTLLCGCSRSEDASASDDDDEEAERLAKIEKEKKRLIQLDEDANKAWAEIDMQLHRLVDLTPNLVETVRGYANSSYEETVFIDIANARSKLAASYRPEEKNEAYDALSRSLERLLAIAENDPYLKTNEYFIRLQDELAGTENRIKVSKRLYNEKVEEFNSLLHELPDSFVHDIGFREREYFETK